MRAIVSLDTWEVFVKQVCYAVCLYCLVHVVLLSISRILQHLERLSRTPWCYEYVVPSSLCHSVKTRICAPKLVNILNKHQ